MTQTLEEKVGNAMTFLGRLEAAHAYLRTAKSDADYIYDLLKEQQARIRELEAQSQWQPIETAPKNERILLAAFIVPSNEAERNGSRSFWDIGIGSWCYENHWSGILGGRPSHWMPLPKPPATEGDNG